MLFGLFKDQFDFAVAVGCSSSVDGYACSKMGIRNGHLELAEAAAQAALKSHARTLGANQELKAILTKEQVALIGYNDGPYAVVSADDRFPAVLGVSKTPYSGGANANFEFWLNAMSGALAYRVQHNMPAHIITPDPAFFPTSVEPLCSSFWDQLTPYNNLLPSGIYTGCVATAVAQIPYGAGKGRRLKFDLDEFCRQFRLQRAAAHYAIKVLEREGHWTYTEDLDVATRVRIRVSRDELYNVSLPDPRMEVLLELLMRRCEGVFSFAVEIDEPWFAKQVGADVPTLRQLLYRLSLEHLVNYVPADRADVLFLHHDRLEPGNVALAPKRYRLLKESAHARMQAMLDYVAEEDTCRSRFLLAYFGQEDSADCGTCDICRSRRVPTEARLKEWIRSREGKYTLADLRSSLDLPEGESAARWSEVLRRLIDDGTVPPPSE